MPRIQAGEQRDRRAPWQVRPRSHSLLPTQPHCPSMSPEAEHRPGKVCELVEGHCFADKQVQLLQGLLSAPPDSLSPRPPPSTCPSPSFESQRPRCTNEPHESFQHLGTFSNRDPGAFDFRILSSPPAENIPDHDHRNGTKQHRGAQRPLLRAFSHPLHCFGSSPSRVESVRPQSPGRQAAHGWVTEAWTPHTHVGRHSGVSAAPIRLGAQAVFDRQTHPLPGDVGGMVGCGWVKSPT